MLEVERKYEVDEQFELPDLSTAAGKGGRVLDLPPVTLVATYFDTEDLRLARAGVSVRHRKGDKLPWTVKLPGDAPGTRHEISRRGRVRTVPSELVDLVTVYTRGAELAPVATVRTVRRAYELRDRSDAVLVEVADDSVQVLDESKEVTAAFREIEVERKNDDEALRDRVGRAMDRADQALCKAGARTGQFVAKHVRALGEAARAEPDLLPPGDLGDRPTAGDVVTQAIRGSVDRLLAHDPMARLRVPVGDDDTAVHQMRVGCRRLRSDLRTFKPLVDREWADALRTELKWLADALGGARDAEVLRDRLRQTATADPACPLDPRAVEHIDTVLEQRHEQALEVVDEALGSQRYVDLVESLVRAARSPMLTAEAGKDAREVLPKLVSRPWRRLARGDKEHPGADQLDPVGEDDQWHAVRISGKKARYAVDAAAPVVGADAEKLAKALARVQKVLGEHQDAAVAAETWLSVSRESADDHDLAVTAGRLFERERTVIRAMRAEFPEVWERVGAGSRTQWLP